MSRDGASHPDQSRSGTTVTVPSDPEPITPQAASELLEGTPAHLIQQALSGRDFAAARGRIYAGFRMKPETLRTPLARGRLITEMLLSADLVKKISDLAASADAARRDPAIKPVQALHPKASAPQAAPAEASPRIAELQRELRDARAQAAQLKTEAEKLTRALEKQSAGWAEQVKQTAHLRSQLAWGERLRKRLEDEIAAGRRGLNQAQPGKREDADAERRIAAGGKSAEGSVFFEALERLISRRKWEAVEMIVEEALRIDPNDAVSLRARALLSIARGDPRAALSDLGAALGQQIESGQYVDAAATLCKAVAAAPTQSRSMAQSLFAALARDRAAISAAADVFTRIEGTASWAHLRSWCRAPLADLLFPPAESSSMGPNSAGLLPAHLFDSPELGGITAARIVQAIDTGDAKLVMLLRGALQKIDKLSRRQVESVIAQLADESYARVLGIRTLCGPAIIDASNVAYYEQEFLAKTKPSLSNLLAVRKELRMKGYFPISLIADANLPFMIDAPKELRAMVHGGELELVDSGTDADEVIVRAALRTGAVVVSNDYMADWDKDDAIRKAQFSISLTDGSASLYF